MYLHLYQYNFIHLYIYPCHHSLYQPFLYHISASLIPSVLSESQSLSTLFLNKCNHNHPQNTCNSATLSTSPSTPTSDPETPASGESVQVHDGTEGGGVGVHRGGAGRHGHHDLAVG